MDAIQRFNRQQINRQAWTNFREACILAGSIGTLLALYCVFG